VDHKAVLERREKFPTFLKQTLYIEFQANIQKDFIGHSNVLLQTFTSAVLVYLKSKNVCVRCPW
jgi:hypothetical protein